MEIPFPSHFQVQGRARPGTLPSHHTPTPLQAKHPNVLDDGSSLEELFSLSPCGRYNTPFAPFCIHAFIALPEPELFCFRREMRYIALNLYTGPRCLTRALLFIINQTAISSFTSIPKPLKYTLKP